MKYWKCVSSVKMSFGQFADLCDSVVTSLHIMTEDKESIGDISIELNMLEGGLIGYHLQGKNVEASEKIG